MSQVERIGVSLEKDLLSQFDELIEKKGYPNRSEAIRDLIREQLSQKEMENPNAEAVAAVSIVYDHHATQLMQKLTALQHQHLLQTISSLHVHLNEHDCMEIIVLKGRIKHINSTAEQMLSHKGVKLGKVNLIPTQIHNHQVECNR
ncbi:MAG: nickel-responsive transcriptional regulator NikR [Sedimentisphaerales bacterium]|nr:nickel-responsive transcriptional regulator NikR [Sedimentisphaerales bacterium]